MKLRNGTKLKYKRGLDNLPFTKGKIYKLVIDGNSATVRRDDNRNGYFGNKDDIKLYFTIITINTNFFKYTKKELGIFNEVCYNYIKELNK